MDYSSVCFSLTPGAMAILAVALYPPLGIGNLGRHPMEVLHGLDEVVLLLLPPPIFRV